MAEVFGLAAAGIGVAPIAFELAKTVKKLMDYCRDVRSAREDVQEFADEVDAIYIILQQLERFGIADCPSSSQGLQRCQDLCVKANGVLSSIVMDLQVGLKHHGRRTQLAFPLKKDKMKQLTDRLERAKSSLLLACNVYSMWQTRMQAQAQQQLISEVFTFVRAQGTDHEMKFDALLTQHSTNSLTLKSTGVVRLSAQATQSGDHFVVRRAPGGSRPYRLHDLLSSMWSACFSVATRGWTAPLRSYRIVPWTDDAVRAIENGDITSYQRMICAGEASIYDQTEMGESMLYIAAKYREMHILRWLHQMGAVVEGFVEPSGELLYAYWYQTYVMESRTHAYQSIAQANEDILSIKTLFDSGQDSDDTLERANPTDQTGFSPLMLTSPIELWDVNYAFLATSSYLEYITGDLWRSPSGFLRSLLALVKRSKWEREIWRKRDNTGRPLMHKLALAWITACPLNPMMPMRPTMLWHDLREFICCGILAGADIHAVDRRGHSPWYQILTQASCYYAALADADHSNKAVESWVGLLAAQGIDLAEYGKVETQLSRKAHRPDDDGLVVYGFAYGNSPKDWYLFFEELGDRYAGIFWDMVEHPERRLPGAWVEPREYKIADRYYNNLHAKRKRQKHDGKKAFEQRQRAAVEEIVE